MNVLLLGGSGYLGKHLLPILSENNNVICIGRNLDKFNFIDSFEISKKNRITLVENDKEKIVDLFQDFKKNKSNFDWVINLSCSYMKNGNYRVWESNYQFPTKIVTLLIDHNLFKGLLTIGTGLPSEFNLYGFSKKQFFDYACYMNQVNNNLFSICNVVLENFYGEDEPCDRFLPSTITKLLKNENIKLTEGLQHRDFIYIEDVVNAIQHILTYYSKVEDGGNYVIPLGTGEAPTIREIVEYCKSESNSYSKLLFGEIPLRWNEPDSVANTKQLNKIGFIPKYNWKDGMKLMIQRMRK